MQFRPVVLLLLVLYIQLSSCLYSDYYPEAQKIVVAMTLDQKIGQTLLVDVETITDRLKDQTNPTDISDLALGGVYVAATSAPSIDGNLARVPTDLEDDKQKTVLLQSTTINWKKLTDRLNAVSVDITTKDGAKYKIKPFVGTDAAHGDQHTVGTVLFPHNIGLSCTHNPDHFENMGYWTTQGVKASGFNYVFAPNVAVSHNPQWGRFYESLGQEDTYIKQYAASFIKGLQAQQGNKIYGAIGTAKHFFGDGTTRYGANSGISFVNDFSAFLNHNSQGYIGAIQSNVGSVMLSRSSINYVENAMNSDLILGYLRDTLQFDGFTVTDVNEISKTDTMLYPRTFFNITTDKSYAVLMAAGTDMMMVSATKIQLDRIIKPAKKNVERNEVNVQRLDDAVAKILSVKLAMGLASKLSTEVRSQEDTPSKHILPPLSSSSNQYADSLNAVHESLVLLKNTNNLLPLRSLRSGIKYVVMLGEKIYNINRLTKIRLFRNFDNIGMQSGGWSVKWQGFEGNDFWDGQNKASSNASSILDALNALRTSNNVIITPRTQFTILYPNYTSLTNEVTIDNERNAYINQLKTIRKDMNPRNTIILGVFGEFPYAESVGDVNLPYCKVDGDPGCSYDPFGNPYAPGFQARTLDLPMSKFQNEVYTAIKEQDKSIPLVSVLMTGRPRLIGSLLDASASVLTAWLPGTSGGQGIVDALVGDYIIRAGGDSARVNSLSMDWPRDMTTISDFPTYEVSGDIPKINDPLFKVGFGLSTGSTVEAVGQQSKTTQ